MNRNYVYASPSVHGTYNIVNYKAEANDINSFLSVFDVWRSHGHFKMSEDNNHQEVWFECSKEFFEMLHTETMQRAFKRMGVDLVFEYPFMREKPDWWGGVNNKNLQLLHESSPAAD